MDIGTQAPGGLIAKSPRSSLWLARKLAADRFTTVVGLILLALVVMIIFAPVFATHDPYQGSVLRRLGPIGANGHLLGTDEAGRDLWSRMLYGGRLSLLIGTLPVVFA